LIVEGEEGKRGRGEEGKRGRGEEGKRWRFFRSKPPNLDFSSRL
jgi:hypothetical protein